MTEGASPPAIRISTAERERAIAILRDAVVDGRLNLEEYSERVGSAVAARTDQELAVLTRDLPQTARARMESAGDGPAVQRAICSHIVRRGPLMLDHRSAYTSIFGTIDLDLRQARLPGSDAEIHVYNVFGTVTILVPDGVDVRMDGGAVMGSEHVDISSTSLVAGAPVVRVRVSGMGGTVYVRTQEARTWQLAVPQRSPRG